MLRVLIAGLCCSACMVPVGSVPPREQTPAAPPAAVAYAELAAQVLAESNRARAAAGRNALVREPALERAAMQYAAELAALRRLSHESRVAGRETMAQRIAAEGVSYRRAGENLASMSDRNANVARQTIEMWLGSPGHRANLLDSEYTHSGAGVAADSRGAWYVVQLYMIPQARR